MYEETRPAVRALRSAEQLPCQLIASGNFTEEDCMAAGAVKCIPCASGSLDALVGDGYTSHEVFSNRRGCKQCGGDP